jgi:hypothetical protein
LSLELIVIIFLLVVSCVSIYYAVKFGLLLLRLEDDIEASLDDIDESFKALSEILKKPIFFDSLEVRQCIVEIKKCRNVVIKIANRMTSFGNNTQKGEVLKNDDKRQKENNQITG